jgi:hypothetical protein
MLRRLYGIPGRRLMRVELFDPSGDQGASQAGVKVVGKWLILPSPCRYGQFTGYSSGITLTQLFGELICTLAMVVIGIGA